MQSLWKDAGSAIEVVRLEETGEIEDMVRLFEIVAHEQSWQPGEALRLWRHRSLYFALQVPEQVESEPRMQRGKLADGRLAGGLQLVLPDTLGLLPCHDLWPEVPSGGKGRAAHVAMLAVDAEFRGHSQFFWHLAVEMWRACVAEGITTLLIEVTPRVLPLYRRLGWPLHIRGEARLHWGEECYLCALGIPEVAHVILERAETSHYYRQIAAQAFRVTLVANGGTIETAKTAQIAAA